MKQPALRSIVVLVVGSLLLTLTGCRSPVSWNLQFHAKSKSLIRFDVVGINAMEKADWTSVTVDDYWTNQVLRKDAHKLSFEMTEGKIRFAETNAGLAQGIIEGITGYDTSTNTVLRTSPAWRQWLGRHAVALVVIGDFPGAPPPGPEQRKRIIPIYRDVWDAKKRTLEFEIQGERIQVITPWSSRAPKVLPKRGF